MFTEESSVNISNFIVKLTLSCPYALSTHFYSTDNLLGTPKTQHLRAVFLALEHTQLLLEVLPRAVTSRSWWITTSPFFLHSWDNTEVVLHGLLEFLSGIEFLYLPTVVRGLITHLLLDCFHSGSFSFPLAVLPGINSQIKLSHSSSCLRVCFWRKLNPRINMSCPCTDAWEMGRRWATCAHTWKQEGTWDCE